MTSKVADIEDIEKASETNEKSNKSEGDDSNSIPFFFIFLCTLCMTSLYSSVLTYNITVTQIHSYGNGSDEDFYEVLDYRKINDTTINYTLHRHRFLSNPQKESLITVAPIGGLLALFPIAKAYNNIGFRRSFVLCAFLCIIPAALIPMCTNAQTFVLVVILRIIQGTSLAVFLPYICKMSVYLPFQHPAIPTIMFTYIQLSAFLTFPLAGLLSWSSLGWHSVHYGSSIISALLFLVFILINYDDEFKEKASYNGIFDACFLYERSRSHPLNFRLPYLSIYQDLKVWSVFIGSFGYFTAIHLYLQFGPTFLNKVVDVSIVGTGILSMVAPAAHIFISYSSLLLYPRLANSERNKMRFFNSLGSVAPGILFMLIGLFDPDTQPASVTLLFVSGCSLLGFSSCGFFRMSQSRSKQFHLFMLLNLFLINLASMFLASTFNVIIAKNNEYTSWGVILVLHGGILFVCNIIFCIFADAEPAAWTKDGYEDTSIQPRREDPLPQRPL